MEVELTPAQQAFVKQGVARGDYRDTADAVASALRFWEERERRRTEIRAALDEGEADLEAGRYREYSDDTLDDLSEEIAAEARKTP